MPTKNNRRAERQYQKDFVRLLIAIFAVKTAFALALQPLQAVDGITHNQTAFTVKTNNTPVVFNEYDTEVELGAGKSRFGKRTEIIYVDTDVPYNKPWAFDEALDKFTVNEDFNFAIAERLAIRSEGLIKRFNKAHGAFIAAKAGNAVEIAALDEATLNDVFAAASAFYLNEEVAVGVTAYVTADVFNVLIKSGLITADKNSNVNIDGATLYEFFGFRLEKTPKNYFGEKDHIYFVPNGIIIPFVGIASTRVLTEVEGHDGVVLQAAGKEGTYVNDDNAAVITKVTLTTNGG